MPAPTSFVLVPGAWHHASTWDKVSAILEAKGHRCAAVTLPSTQGNAAASFLDDVKATQAVIASETSQGNNVVVVVHSYGGLVGASAARGFTREPHGGAPAAAAERGAVVGIALIATGFAIEGMALLDGTGGKPPPSWVINEDTGFADIVVDARDMMYHDLPEDEGNAMVASLGKQSVLALQKGGEHVYSGWMDVSCWYLLTEDHRALPAQIQEMAIKMGQDAGVDVVIKRIKTSHSPMLSRPDETAQFLLDAKAAFEAKIWTAG